MKQKFDINSARMKFIYDEIVRKVCQAVKLTEDVGMTNSQEFINFLDKLNEISVKY